MNFVKWLQKEMALGAYSVAPSNPNAPKLQNFTPADRQVLNHPKTKAQLEKVLQSSKHVFNIIMLEMDTSLGKRSQVYEPMVREYCKQNNIPMQGRITFAKDQSSGEPLTPWMQLHNIGHALLERNNFAQNHFLNTIGQLTQLCQQANIPVTKAGPTSILMFRSARLAADPQTQNHKFAVVDGKELLYEMVADYLWNGRIRISPTANPIIQKVKPLIQQMEQAIESELDMAEGGVIIEAD